MHGLQLLAWAAAIAIALFVIPAVDASAPELSVQGAVLVERSPTPNATWRPTRRLGVSGTGALFNCIGGHGIFDGATGAEYMTGMRSWGVQIVRVPLNEDCWLGINGVPNAMGGVAYQSALADYVHNLTAFGFNVVLELHWTAAGPTRATGQQPMPDRDHALPFWRSVAQAFGKDRRVVFDLFNEPYPGDDTFDSVSAWECWAYGGGNCTGLSYATVGMHDLVGAVRVAGAENVLMLGGIMYSNSLTRWLEYAPADPLQRLAASWHSYARNHCNNALCWDLYVAPVMQKVPVIVGEIGENDCGGSYIEPLMQWLDANGGGGTGTSYLAWLWAPWDCRTGPALITSYDGGCTDSYGCTFRAHLRNVLAN